MSSDSPRNAEPGSESQSIATASSNPRVELVRALTTAIAAATDAGDITAAKVALDALNKLVTGDVPSGSPVVDLNAARERRGDK